MSKVADSIRRGLKEAVAYAEGKVDESAYRIHVPEKIDVKVIRTRLDMTQEEFAGRFGFSVNPSLASSFTSPYASPHLMALSLTQPMLRSSGRIGYAPAFAAVG